jgi:NitT/TauT family transport system ATP-binding protein
MRPVGAAAPLDIDIEEKRFRSSRGVEVVALSGLRLQVRSGEFVCLFGPSGCGKTTTLRILLGLDRSYTGSVGIPRDASHRLAAVFQEPVLLPWRTVEENIRLTLPPSLKRVELDDLLDALGLTGLEALYPAELSLGLARRVALARAFATEPAILLLDEPFASLDEPTAERLRSLLIDIWSARPTTALMVTHNLREAILLADRIIVLSSRPAHVKGEFDLHVPRQDRSEVTVDGLLQEFKQRFPDLT